MCYSIQELFYCLTLRTLVHNIFGYINEIGDDNDLGNAISIRGLVDTTPNGEEFGFGTSDMNHMVDSLSNGVIVSVRM